MGVNPLGQVSMYPASNETLVDPVELLSKIVDALPSSSYIEQ